MFLPLQHDSESIEQVSGNNPKPVTAMQNDPIDNLEAALEHKLAKQVTFDCCIVCDALIDSVRQLEHPGTDVCEKHAAPHVDLDFHEEER